MATLEENMTLRKLLWLNHGHENLYGDDGEMQCPICMLDFKRDSVAKIEKRFDDIAFQHMLDFAKKERKL